jgi:hypothetical protein
MLSPPPPPSPIKKMYVSLWVKNAYEDYFIEKKKGDPCELHCSQTQTSILDDVWPGVKTTSCCRGDWLGRWRCTSSAQSDVIDFVWYVGGTYYKSEQEATAVYKQLIKQYQENLAKYEEEMFRLKSMIEDIKSDRIIIGDDDFGIRNTSVYDLLW